VSTSASPSAPVVLPLVDVRISKDGIASVTVDNASHDAVTPVERDGVERDGVERAIHEIAAKLGPVRVRVTESDESVFTDVVLPASVPDPPEAPAQPRPGIAGEGFLPGEQVDVAVIVAQCAAGADGRTKLRLPPAVLACRGGAVVLIGRTSGAFTTCETS
jgi:hypothetical protein